MVSISGRSLYPNTAIASLTNATSNAIVSIKSIWTIYPWYALPISALGVFLVTWIVSGLVKIGRRYMDRLYDNQTKDNKDNYQGSFWDIIRDGDYYPSLSRFQFMLWTVVISFVFLSIYLLRIFGGDTGFPPQIPTSILELLGISVAVPVVGNVMSSYKYDTSLSKSPIQKEDVPKLSTMLLEHSKPVLFRYQMFLWTFIGIAIYLVIFFSVFSSTIHDVETATQCSILKTGQSLFAQLGCANLKTLKGLSLPDIDPSLVILMGLSQGGYLGGKLVARTPLRIDRLVTSIDNSLTIFGDNFGDLSAGGGGMVLINDVKVAASTDTSHVSWGQTRIEIPLPTSLIFKDGSVVEVITNDSISAKKTYLDQDLPKVIETNPKDGETSVSATLRKVSAKFSERVDRSTISASSFKLLETKTKKAINGEAVLDTDNVTAEFDFTESLTPASEYQATITKDVKDLAGHSMPEDKIWSFKTS
jgi:Bacterial Ig-like domain